MSAAMFLFGDLRIGGSERKVVRVANALHRAGREIHIAYLNGPHVLRDALDPNIPVVDLKRRGKFSFSAASRLASYIGQHRVKHLCSVHLYPILYAQTAALRHRKTNRLSCSALLNTTDFLSRKQALQMLLYAPLLRRMDDLVFGCNFQMDLWLNRYKLPAAKSEVIYNGVDTSYFSRELNIESRQQLRADYGFSKEDFVFAMVGQLRPEKQHLDFVDAIARLIRSGISAKAIIVGEGEQRDHIESAIAQYALENHILLAGAHKDVRPLLEMANAFVLTSTAVETFSNAALEAMSMDLPCVLSNISGAGEMIVEGENGYLYPPGNVSELERLLRNLIENGAETTAMGKRARQLACERFDFETMLGYYDGLLFGKLGFEQ